MSGLLAVPPNFLARALFAARAKLPIAEFLLPNVDSVPNIP
jgi:hypothetical protein